MLERCGMPKYAVIIATHNRPSLLSRAIQSIKAQGRHDVSVIVVSDDCSAETRKVAHSRLSDGDTFLERGGEPGPALSRTIGLGFATADHVMFLDDDDEFSANFLAEIDIHVRGGTAGSVLFCDFYVANDGEDRAAASIGPPIPVSIGDRDPQGVYVRNFIPNSCLVYPIDAVKANAFDPSLVLNEDWAFLLQAIQGRALRHVPIFGPIIHKTDRTRGDRRGACNDDLLPDNIRAIYRSCPAPTDALRVGRQSFFASAGLSLAIEDV